MVDQAWDGERVAFLELPEAIPEESSAPAPPAQPFLPFAAHFDVEALDARRVSVIPKYA
jgi:hypothetical protein